MAPILDAGYGIWIFKFSLPPLQEDEENMKSGGAAFLPGPPGKRGGHVSTARDAAVKAASIGDGLLNEGRYR